MLCKKAAVAVMIFLTIIGCSHEKFSPTIDNKEAVVNSHGIRIKNREKLDDFIVNKSGTQRVVHYTIEGDPIFLDLSYENNNIRLRYDTTKDKYGAGEVTTYACSQLERKETDKILQYTLTGCEGERKEIQILQIPYDVEKQDRFDFVLKYGVNLRNEINTTDKKLIKDLQNGEVSKATDFQLTSEERQKIYKAMVLANYLDEFQLSSSCNRKPYISYELSVHINSGSRHYQWTECDNSVDGNKMTDLAKIIIDTVQAKDVYKQLPEIKGHYK